MVNYSEYLEVESIAQLEEKNLLEVIPEINEIFHSLYQWTDLPTSGAYELETKLIELAIKVYYLQRPEESYQISREKLAKDLEHTVEAYQYTLDTDEDLDEREQGYLQGTVDANETIINLLQVINKEE